MPTINQMFSVLPTRLSFLPIQRRLLRPSLYIVYRQRISHLLRLVSLRNPGHAGDQPSSSDPLPCMATMAFSLATLQQPDEWRHLLSLVRSWHIGLAGTLRCGQDGSRGI